MDYNSDIFAEQFPIVKRFLYHLIYYRELWAAYHGLQSGSEFWAHTIDAHLLQAANLWCMVFGSQGCNHTHWKNLSKGDTEELQQSFRQGLFEQTDLTSEQWNQYWHDMKDFRDKYAAHRELNYDKPIPDFTIALKVAYYYDRWIREVISPDTLEEPPLEQSSEALKRTVAPLITQLLKKTKGYNQETEQIA